MLIRNHLVAVCALVAVLSVYLLNGAPLYYFDTAGYLAQGASILETLGIDPDPAVVASDGAAAAQAAQDGTAPPADTTVSGARSAVFAVALAGIARLGALDATVLLNAAAIMVLVVMCARCMTGQPSLSTSLALLAASLGSLPFYVDFLMPDIFAPVLILAVALVAAYADRLSRGEIAAAVALSILAVLVHPSHLLIAGLLLPVVVLTSVRLSGRRLALAAVGLLLVLGVTERLAFGYAVERLRHADVLYLPFLTARLIDDGPGYDRLVARCPDPDYPTCLLYAELSASDDPKRLDAPVVLFEKTAGVGSFQRLDEAQKLAVSHDQVRFAADVIRTAPLAVAGALLSNVAAQLAAYRIDMTLMEPDGIATVHRAFPEAAVLREGRLIAADRGWLGPLAGFHGGLYILSAALVLGLIVLPGRLDGRARVLASIVLYGIVANALVCGGISEPADRYGARTMFLLPLAATLLVLAARNPAPARQPHSGRGPRGQRAAG